ncbi:MAG: signal recognition particle receptor subunit alpha, partial [Oligoflexia bacterium]|nr:signal recognition particle receptor subunit alpha [Oligoflexia bacterium]
MFDKLSEKISDAFKNISGKGTISENNIEDALKDIRTALLEAGAEIVEVVSVFCFSLLSSSNLVTGPVLSSPSLYILDFLNA